MVCCSCEELPGFLKGVLKMTPEKYEAPEVEFVEMEEDVVVTSSGCNGYDYGTECTGAYNVFAG